MDLNIFKKNNDEAQATEHFWSLVIGRGWIQAAIWRVVEETVQVVAEGNATSFQEEVKESLVSAADGTLSSAASNITGDISEPNKVVFGLTSAWIVDGSIDENKISLLKNLSSELELDPAGFVVVPEAVVHYLKARDGAPLQAILVGISDDVVDISLVQNGIVLGSAEVSRSMSLGADVAEGLSRLETVSQYPTRILVYGPKAANLEDARQNLLETEWKDVTNVSGQGKVDFLHTPKVEILGDEVILSAVCLAGGAEVAQAKNVIVSTQEQALEEQDQSQEETQGVEPSAPIPVEEAEVSAQGFVQDQDISESEKPQAPLTQKELERHDNLRIPSSRPEYAVPEPQTTPISKLPKLSIPNFWSNFSLPHPKFMKAGVGMFGVVAAGLVLILLGLGLVYWYVPKANVTVYVAPKKLEKVINFTVDPDISVVDQAENIVPGKTREVDVVGEKTTSTSGTKLTGDRAKGVVTITNASGGKSLKSGTILTGPNSLKFTLNEDTTVASASSAAKPSQTKAAVTAGDIGAQYNLASGTEFSVGNFSKLDIVAIADEALSGGTSREVAAVGEKDRTNLDIELMQELLQKGITLVKDELTETEVLVEDSAMFSVSDRSFSHKAGEETTTLKLSLEGKVKVTIIPKDSLDSLVLAKLQSDVPDGFSLRAEQVTTTFQAVEEEVVSEDEEEEEEQVESSTTSEFVASVSANLLPQVNPDDIRKIIAGKFPLVAKEHLATIPGFTRAEISQTITFPGFLGTLPRLPKNIQVEIAAEK